jgi:hypothetical protein
VTNADYLRLVFQNLNETEQAGEELDEDEREELEDLLADIQYLLEDL